jgi:hypothetical protein
LSAAGAAPRKRRSITTPERTAENRRRAFIGLLRWMFP